MPCSICECPNTTLRDPRVAESTSRQLTLGLVPTLLGVVGAFYLWFGLKVNAWVLHDEPSDWAWGTFIGIVFGVAPLLVIVMLAGNLTHADHVVSLLLDLYFSGCRLWDFQAVEPVQNQLYCETCHRRYWWLDDPSVHGTGVSAATDDEHKASGGVSDDGETNCRVDECLMTGEPRDEPSGIVQASEAAGSCKHTSNSGKYTASTAVKDHRSSADASRCSYTAKTGPKNNSIADQLVNITPTTPERRPSKQPSGQDLERKPTKQCCICESLGTTLKDPRLANPLVHAFGMTLAGIAVGLSGIFIWRLWRRLDYWTPSSFMMRILVWLSSSLLSILWLASLHHLVDNVILLVIDHCFAGLQPLGVDVMKTRQIQRYCESCRRRYWLLEGMSAPKTSGNDAGDAKRNTSGESVQCKEACWEQGAMHGSDSPQDEAFEIVDIPDANGSSEDADSDQPQDQEDSSAHSGPRKGITWRWQDMSWHDCFFHCVTGIVVYVAIPLWLLSSTSSLAWLSPFARPESTAGGRATGTGFGLLKFPDALMSSRVSLEKLLRPCRPTDWAFIDQDATDCRLRCARDESCVGIRINAEGCWHADRCADTAGTVTVTTTITTTAHVDTHSSTLPVHADQSASEDSRLAEQIETGTPTSNEPLPPTNSIKLDETRPEVSEWSALVSYVVTSHFSCRSFTYETKYYQTYTVTSSA